MILKKKGKESQHEAYVRNEQIYVRVGSSFIALLWKSTSAVDYSVIAFDLAHSDDVYLTPTGRVVTAFHHSAERLIDSVKYEGDAPPEKPKRKSAPRKRRKT